MGMIACSDCGQQIGENALFCPHCGSAAGLMRKGQRFMVRGFAIAITVLLILAGLGFALFLYLQYSGG